MRERLDTLCLVKMDEFLQAVSVCFVYLHIIYNLFVMFYCSFYLLNKSYIKVLVFIFLNVLNEQKWIEHILFKKIGIVTTHFDNFFFRSGKNVQGLVENL